MSLAGQEAAEARQKANSTIGYYNLRLGPTAWRFGSSLDLEYNSNVRYTDRPESDLIIRPGITAQMLMPLTSQNSLNLQLGGGYSAYTEHSGLSRSFINPGSELAMDFYIGDFWINAHDRFSIVQDTYQDPTVAGSGGYSRLDNTAGVGALWDLNKAVVRGAFDYSTYKTLDNAANLGGTRDGQNETMSVAAGYEVRPQMMVGLEEGIALIQYQTDASSFFADALQWNSGVYMEAPVTEYLKFRVNGGYTVFQPDFVPGVARLPGMGSQLDGFYYSAQAQHRLNEFFTHSIDMGRNISYTFYGGTADLSSVRWTGNLSLIRDTGISAWIGYEWGTQYNMTREDFDRIGGGVSAGRQITKKLRAGVEAQYYVRNSDYSSSSRDYSVLIGDLKLSYTF